MSENCHGETEFNHKADDLSSNFGNDYSNQFVKKRIFPQSSVTNIKNPFQGYPRLEKLQRLKCENYDRYSQQPVCLRVSENDMVTTLNQIISEDVKFDVIMVGGCYEQFSILQLESLPIAKMSARPSLLFLWVPSNRIADGRKLMEKWRYRHGEDITYHVRSEASPHCPDEFAWTRNDTMLRPTTWHCLMGLNGTLRRSTDTHLIHCNVDTDVIVERQQTHSVVPDEAYKLIENFTSMNRKIHVVPTSMPEELFTAPRKGWLVVSPDAFPTGNFDANYYCVRKQIPVSIEIDNLRPKTPPAI
ncbi:Kar4 protein [Starmerella bacillaris]|uniref:Kar4 protein n=1 Tax=Starmerella bacillaris TaxID=1247836 RepID=A0AAV5RQH0_STABA|nr:Kar4 protein [Starmerella bacillaris]